MTPSISPKLLSAALAGSMGAFGADISTDQNKIAMCRTEGTVRKDGRRARRR